MSEQTNQEQREFTAQEIADYRKKTLAYYSEQKKVLSLQCEVEELKARINKAKFESLESTFRLAQLTNAINQPEDEEDKDSPKADPELKPE